MTDDERKRTFGGIVLELRELKSTEPCLVHKLQRMMSGVELAAAVSAKLVMREEPEFVWRVDKESGLFFGFDDEEFPAAAELGACLEELTKTRKRIAVCKERIDAC